MHDKPEREPAETPQRIEPPTLAVPAGSNPDENYELAGVPEAIPLDGDEVVPFGDYELLNELGRGGMGVVYKARERHSGQIVALKMMLNEKGPKASELRRFRLEAKAAGQLSHPGIITIHSWGEHADALFYTMDFVPGVTLGSLMIKGRLRHDRAVHYLIGIARAVASAHTRGIVHRDLKPNNIIIDVNDQPRVLDFGLAKQQRALPGDLSLSDSIAEALPADAGSQGDWLFEPQAPVAQDTDSRSHRATREGAIVGTPTYMAPEQAIGAHDKICPATDVHALGAIFYEMLMGRPPFQGGSVLETLLLVRQREPDAMWVEGRRIPPALEAVCRRCLQKEARDRYPDAGALADDLEQKWERARQSRRCAWVVLTAGALGLLCGYVGLTAALRLGPLRAGQAMQTAAPGLATLLTALLFLGSGSLALAAHLAALAAWVWHSSRPWLVPVCALAVLLAAACVALMGHGAVALSLAVFLTVEAATLALTWVGRQTIHLERPSAEAPGVRTDPFLHRLLGGGGQFSSRKDRKVAPESVKGLADIEMGKVILRWDGGQVRRGRQKALERAVLVWQDTTPASEGAPLPGVSIRHPGILLLHAAGSTPEGRYLVTELAPATPLVEMLQREPLPPHAAVQLAIDLARAIQAIHSQGAYLGQLRPEWIMLRSGLEPALCPCCVPSQAPEDLLRDSQALGRLLLEWLPPRPTHWERRPFAPFYAVATAAQQGRYLRMSDLTNDLQVALQEVTVRRRERWPALAVALTGVLAWGGLLSLQQVTPGSLMAYLVQALIPCAILMGFMHAQRLIHRFQFRYAVKVELKKSGLRRLPVQLAFLIVPPVVVFWSDNGGLLAGGLLLSYWFLGACLAGLLALGMLLFRSLLPRTQRFEGIAAATP